MTIDEFFVAQHAINDGNFLPSDMHTGKDFEQARESEHVRQWVLGVAEKYGMDNCDCPECSSIPDGPEKQLMNIASALELAFLFGIRCGRMVPE